MGHLAPAATPIYDRYITPGGVLVDVREWGMPGMGRCYRVADDFCLGWIELRRLVRVW